MNLPIKLQSSVLLAALCLVPLAHAAPMDKDAYNAAKSRIESDYKTARESCNSLAGNAKDVCVEEAKATEKVARAEADYGHSGKPADQTKVLTVKAETSYAVAKEKCDDKGGNAKNVCLKEAKAAGHGAGRRQGGQGDRRGPERRGGGQT